MIVGWSWIRTATPCWRSLARQHRRFTTLLPSSAGCALVLASRPHLLVADRAGSAPRALPRWRNAKLEYFPRVRERAAVPKCAPVIDDQLPLVPAGRAAVSGELTELRPSRFKIGTDGTSAVAISAECARMPSSACHPRRAAAPRLAQAQAPLHSWFPPLSQARSPDTSPVTNRVRRRRRSLTALCAAHQHQAHPASVRLRYRDRNCGSSMFRQPSRAATRHNLPQHDMAIRATFRVLPLPCFSSRNSRIAPPSTTSRPNGTTPARSLPLAVNRT